MSAVQTALRFIETRLLHHAQITVLSAHSLMARRVELH
jgi:hypothetical protein